MRRTLTLVERSIVPPKDPNGGYNVRIVSGSATDRRNQATIQSAIKDRVTFQATVQTDNVLFPEMVRQITRDAWANEIAVLFESNTQVPACNCRKRLSRQTTTEGSHAPTDQADPAAFPDERLTVEDDGAG